MPTNVVKTPTQEKKWNRAKAIAAKEGKGKNYAYIMDIFKNMGGLDEAFMDKETAVTHHPNKFHPFLQGKRKVRPAKTKTLTFGDVRVQVFDPDHKPSDWSASGDNAGGIGGGVVGIKEKNPKIPYWEGIKIERRQKYVIWMY